ncbi:MAG: hypothetical protein V3T23_13950, partial [Nitrososphaerales archaeon]
MKREPAKVHFDGYSVNLDGSPAISANCWDAIVDTVKEVCQQNNTCRYLEWGSGNSTKAILKVAIDSGQQLDIVSVEHHPEFYKVLAKDLVAVFCNALSSVKRTISIEVFRIRGPYLSVTDFLHMKHKVRAFESYFLKWQHYSGNKHIRQAAGRRPNFNIGMIRVAKQAIKSALSEFNFTLWKIKGLARGLTSSSKRNLYRFEPVFSNDVLLSSQQHIQAVHSAIDSVNTAAKIVIRVHTVILNYYLVPQLQSSLWGRRTIDGLFIEFPDYVLCPVGKKFDVIFVDGRARVSCIKRVHHDGLLDVGGTLFVH